MKYKNIPVIFLLLPFLLAAADDRDKPGVGLVEQLGKYLPVAYLPFDIKLGLLEASEGKIGPTISKILLYCFRYDPDGKRYVFDILKVTGTVTLFFLVIFVTWLAISTRRRKKKEQKTGEKKQEKEEDKS